MSHKKQLWVLGGVVLALPALLAVSCGIGLLAVSGGGISSSPTTCIPNDTVSLAPAPVQINTVDVTLAGHPLASDQISNASTIVGVASTLGLSYRDALVGLMVAIQESSLRNLPYGDRDSLGLFQQRPSQGWGTPEQILNPIYAANKFFTALKAVPNRDNLSLIAEAETVQRPDPTDYARTFNSWQPTATALLGTSYQSLDSGSSAQQVAYDPACPAGTSTSSSVPTATSSVIEAFVQVALGVVGTPYVWGGQSPSGGFDCSGLVLWALSQVGINYPDMTAAGEYNLGTHVTRDQLQRGDLVFWATNPSDPSTIDHVAIYLGNNQIVVAPHTGAFVGIDSMYYDGFIGGTRLTVPATAVSSTSPAQNWQLPIVSSNYGADAGTQDGVDYSAPSGTPVYAASNGIVSSVGSDPNLGLYVMVDHQGGVQTEYAHLQNSAAGITKGTQIKSGGVIGYVGSSGSGLGNRLLFIVRVNGQPTDPVQFLRQQGVRP